MSGLNLLYKLLLKDVVKGSGQASGIMSIGGDIRKLADKKFQSYVMSAQKQGVDLDKLSEQELKYILEMNKPKPVKAISADSPEGEILTRDLFNMLDRQSGQNVIKTDFGGGITDDVSEIIIKIKTMEPMDAMKEANKVLKGEGRYKSLSKADRKKIVNDESVTDHIFERNIEPDPEDFAQGGRTGYFTGALADTKQGKSMSPGTRHDYSPGQGHRATADANKQLAEINKFHNMKLKSMEIKPPKRSIKDKIGGGINRFFNNPLVRGAAAYGTFGGSEKLRAAMMAKQLYDNRKYFTDDAIEEEVSTIPTMGGIKPSYAHGGRTGSGLNYLLGEDDQNSRVPYGKGKLVDVARRKFLQWLGAGAAGTAAATSGLFSLLKGGAKKQVIKDLTSVPIKSGVDGLPAWFKPLVNKVIKEGEDVTKQFATKEREIVHQVSLEGKIGSPHALGVEDIRVTQSLDDGIIRVEYNSPNTIGESGVELVYKQGEEIPVKVKGKNTSVKEKDKFTASEDDFYPQATSPDDFDLEFTENIVKNVDDLYSDTSKLKQFATGKNLTIKEVSESIKKKKILKEIEKNPNEHAFRNVPDEPPYDYASGGRVPLSGGGIAGMLGE